MIDTPMLLVVLVVYIHSSFLTSDLNACLLLRQSLLSLHLTKSYVRTATRSTLKVEANLTQILNFKANFHTEFEPFKKKKFMLTMVDTLRLSA